MFANRALFEDDGDAPPQQQQQRPVTRGGGRPPTRGGSVDNDYDRPPPYGRSQQQQQQQQQREPEEGIDVFMPDSGGESVSNNYGGGGGVGGLGIQTESPADKRKKLMEAKKQALAKRKNKLSSTGMMRSEPVPSRTSSTSQLSSQPSQSSMQTRGLSTAGSVRNSIGSVDDGKDDEDGEGTLVSPLDPRVQELLEEKQKERREKQLSPVEREMLAQGISPTFDPTKKLQSGMRLDLSDMRNFLTSPVPPGSTIQCYIIRNTKGIKNKLYPKYEMYLEQNETFLLAGEKRKGNKTSNYLIGMDKKTMTKDSGSFLGKVRSNFVGTEFVLYDKGINPRDIEEEQSSISALTVRQELGVVYYESNILGTRGPRKMTALVPHVNRDGSRPSFRPRNETESMRAKFDIGQRDGILALTNKTPKWNEQVAAYVLNFNGRVTMASVKNFQLISELDPETVILQFGRTAKEKFTCDFTFPLSPLQAFGICMSSFDNKIACE